MARWTFDTVIACYKDVIASRLNDVSSVVFSTVSGDRGMRHFASPLRALQRLEKVKENLSSECYLLELSPTLLNNRPTTTTPELYMRSQSSPFRTTGFSLRGGPAITIASPPRLLIQVRFKLEREMGAKRPSDLGWVKQSIGSSRRFRHHVRRMTKRRHAPLCVWCKRLC